MIQQDDIDHNEEDATEMVDESAKLNEGEEESNQENTEENGTETVTETSEMETEEILLEGSPGVGKTSLVLALGKFSGHSVVCLNLSEQTDMMDLLGLDLPVESDEGMQFAWSDGILLQGLNAILDHRAKVFIPELGHMFKCPSSFRVFACQNPTSHYSGVGRKGLPKSFLNRFTKDADFFTLWAEEMLIEDNLVLDILFIGYYESFCTSDGKQWKKSCLLYEMISGSCNFGKLAILVEVVQSIYHAKVQLLLILIQTLYMENLLQMVHDKTPFRVVLLVLGSVLRTFISAFIASYEISLQESLCVQFLDRDSFIDGPVRCLLYNLEGEFPFRTVELIRLLTALSEGAWPAECIYNFLDKSVGLTTLVDRRGNLGIDNNSRTVETLYVPGLEGLKIPRNTRGHYTQSGVLVLLLCVAQEMYPDGSEEVLSYNSRKRLGGAVPVLETFRKQETVGNFWKRDGNVCGKWETFLQLGHMDRSTSNDFRSGSVVPNRDNLPRFLSPFVILQLILKLKINYNFLDKSVELTTLVDRRGNLGIDNNSRTVETLYVPGLGGLKIPRNTRVILYIDFELPCRYNLSLLTFAFLFLQYTQSGVLVLLLCVAQEMYPDGSEEVLSYNSRKRLGGAVPVLETFRKQETVGNK
ncbi:hypothetical protein CTI12_AA533750 [Artemisia annua]|uniref:Midasin n=1 Tax=Artemisia annua TaxID=35608 RepID=A0A2U1L0J7_ARTAN|nr:hypothetical protein CTI12_AA533750 [Artemisia annua]